MINQESIVWIMIIVVIIFLGFYSYPRNKILNLRRSVKSLEDLNVEHTESELNQPIKDNQENDSNQEWLPITVKVPMTRTEYAKYFDKDQTVKEKDKELFALQIKNTLIEVKNMRLIKRSHSVEDGYVGEFEYLSTCGIHKEGSGLICNFIISLVSRGEPDIKQIILNTFEKAGIKPKQIRYVTSRFDIYQYVTVEYWPRDVELILGPSSPIIEVKKLELNLQNYDIRTALFDLYLEDKNWRLTDISYFENPTNAYPLKFTIEYWDKAKK